VKHLRREYSFLAATAAIGAGGFFVGQAMASTLEAGSVSILNYGTRLSAVLLAIGPAALGVTILPHFSQFAAERDWAAFKDSLVRVLLGWTTFSALACVFLVLFSTPIVRLALQRGAFTAEDTSAVAAVQVCALLQVPFVVGITILMRVLAALKSNRVLLSASSGALLVNVILNFVLMKRYGVAGIALAASVSQAVLWIVLVAAVFRQRGWGILTNNR
jgi:putative peptidoglycan lipid II flippase